MENYAVLMKGIKNLEIEKVEMPELTEGNILVKMEYVGICGSDVHFYENGRIGDFIVEPPFILGHESAGVVEAVGRNVKGFSVGDRVALEPGVPCGSCVYCKSGKYNLCPEVAFMATPPHNGAFRNYVSFPAHMAFKLPEKVSTMEGALVEPLAVGLHAGKLGEVGLGSKVLVLGSGCIGLVTLMACKAMGATEVFVADIIEKRLDYAKKLGATQIINSKKENLINRINELTDNVGVDVVIETAGSDITLKQSPYTVRRGGTIVVVGLSPNPLVEFDFTHLLIKEGQIKTLFRYRNLYPVAIQAIENGNINVRDIVTHEFSFQDTKKAFDYVIENKQDVVKAVIKLV